MQSNSITACLPTIRGVRRRTRRPRVRSLRAFRGGGAPVPVAQRESASSVGSAYVSQPHVTFEFIDYKGGAMSIE